MLLLRGSPKCLTTHDLTLRGEPAVRGFEYRSNFRRRNHRTGLTTIPGLNPKQDPGFRDEFEKDVQLPPPSMITSSGRQERLDSNRASTGLTADIKLPNLVGRMTKPIPLFILVGLIAAGVTLVSWQYPSAESHLQQFLTDGPALWFLAFLTLAALPLVFWMPRIRAGFFSRSWKVPSRAYVLPTWIVGLITAFAWGHVLAMLVLTALNDSRALALFVPSFLVAIAFTAGALHRLRRPREEFEMPWLRWNLRAPGWRLRR